MQFFSTSALRPLPLSLSLSISLDSWTQAKSFPGARIDSVLEALRQYPRRPGPGPGTSPPVGNFSVFRFKKARIAFPRSPVYDCKESGEGEGPRGRGRGATEGRQRQQKRDGHEPGGGDHGAEGELLARFDERGNREERWRRRGRPQESVLVAGEQGERLGFLGGRAGP